MTVSMHATLEILLVDDDELDRMAIVRALKQSALQVNITQAKSASEGLLLAGSKSFDLFILDYRDRKSVV